MSQKNNIESMRPMNGISSMSPVKPMRLISPMSSFFLITMGLLLAGCQSDSLEPAGNRQRTSVELLSYSSPFVDVAPWVTRADPDFHFDEGYTNHLPNGYLSYELLHPHASQDDSTIGVFMTPDDVNPTGDFIYQGINASGISEWNSTITVEKDKQYYIYGFMPRSGAETASITSLNLTGGNDFANGAIITINNYDALTTADVSVIAGLRWATQDEQINGIAPTGSDVPLGHFSYVGQNEGDNRLFVLLKHIYAGLHFATKLDPVYHGLRTIRITEVKLTAVNIKEKVNLRIEITANSEGTDPITDVRYTAASDTTTNKTITLYKKTGAANDLGVEVPEDHYNDFLGCLVPGSTDNFVLRTTYDVYDTNVTTAHPEGNLIRKDCVAENKINTHLIAELTQLRAGELFTVNLLIKPTFLYMLSEPDLDNPTITIN